ncbi:D-lyxose/D-mannose family sugar isomerase [Actibacterium sp. 188UL27-1]|uniref:D-lyxose/D-mannose family sugar isomerase n=1 Tax=Actibacterium sp. 188UL27-1 TaxID=2786961 RepID=UPI00195C0D83|nr:D-lyxose/D-mannose family sugar isomerase [Actibacterium sp. 188UL27-1]MBM7069649.1 D-lyxose/D-mannose family sugar isomerase [Actibacterium sp. 188UL27-1]
MLRSQINAEILRGIEFISGFGFVLPPFAHWSPDKMQAQRAGIQGIIDGGLGWDITDYGESDFARLGLFLFTVRNGRLSELQAGRGFCYAEKIMISRQDQISPMHRHILKTEDIINRGGARLAIEMFASDPDGQIDAQAPVTVATDGILRTLKAGDILLLEPGESVTLEPGNWHAFWGDGGDVLIGEVSSVNDDHTDNVFRDPIGRFPEIKEDCDPVHLLVGDYAKLTA